MNLKFHVTETDTLAFSEQYYRSSPSHIKLRESTRILLPLMLTPVLLLYIYNFGFSPIIVATFLIAMIGWYVLYPQRFDKNVRAHMKKQMQESGYANTLGPYEVSFNDEHLVSIGPTGESKFKWSAVNRTELTDKYLFVFLSGAQGFVISVSEIGADAARNAHELISQKVKNAGQQIGV